MIGMMTYITFCKTIFNAELPGMNKGAGKALANQVT